MLFIQLYIQYCFLRIAFECLIEFGVLVINTEMVPDVLMSSRKLGSPAAASDRVHELVLKDLLKVPKRQHTPSADACLFNYAAQSADASPSY